MASGVKIKTHGRSRLCKFVTGLFSFSFSRVTDDILLNFTDYI